jgi:dihydrofolate reductase
MISIIVAVAKNNAIGKDNQLLWHISEDLTYFKCITSGHPVIMGRKTYDSIGKPLPNRKNIVISRNMQEQEGIIIVPSLEAALEMTRNEAEAFVIGGGSIYREALPIADKLYLTKVNIDYDADTFFPEVKTSEWKEISREDFLHGEKFPHPFSFIVYERK